MGVGLLGIGYLGVGNGAPGQLAAGRPGLLKVREASGLGDERDEARRLRAGWQTERLWWLAGRIKA